MSSIGLILILTTLLIVYGPERFSGGLKRAYGLFQDLLGYMGEIRGQLQRNHFHQSNFPRDPESPPDLFANFVVVIVFFVALIFFLQESGIFTAAWLTPFGPN